MTPGDTIRLKSDVIYVGGRMLKAGTPATVLKVYEATSGERVLFVSAEGAFGAPLELVEIVEDG